VDWFQKGDAVGLSRVRKKAKTAVPLMAVIVSYAETVMVKGGARIGDFAWVTSEIPLFLNVNIYSDGKQSVETACEIRSKDRPFMRCLLKLWRD
jgi:hypothetical protein